MIAVKIRPTPPALISAFGTAQALVDLIMIVFRPNLPPPLRFINEKSTPFHLKNLQNFWPKRFVLGLFVTTVATALIAKNQSESFSLCYCASGPYLAIKTMLHSIKGRLVEKSPVHVVIETGGIAYFLNISLGTFGKLGDREDIMLYTHFNINGNDYSLNLYGFADEAERNLFRKLISVSGVGPNTARMVLSGMSTEEVSQMILLRDVAGFKRIKGIGEKTAERIIVDLYDKLSKGNDIMLEKISISHNTVRQEALAALTSLGLERTKTEKTLDKVMVLQPGIALEDLIKQVLKQL